MSLFIKSYNGVLRCQSVLDVGRSGNDLKQNISEIEGISLCEIVLTCNGRLVEDDDTLHENCVYHVGLTLKGGKGGFGSMLRMLGAQIEKTTNHEACRDLSGRRMRDVNNEKKLAEWVKNKADAEAEREKRRREKLERMARDPKHYFVDPNYDQQKQAVAESLEEAVTKGMEASASTSIGASTSGAAASVKRKGGVNGNSSSSKKRCMWMGVEDESDDDDEEEDDEDDNETHQAFPEESHSSEDITKEEGSSAASSPPQMSSSPSEVEKEDEVSEDTKDSEQERKADSETSSSNKIQADQNVSGENTSEKVQQEAVPEDNGPVDLSEYTSASDLEVVGLERLKTALMDRGIKCGGTLQQRAERLFSVKGLSPEQIDPSLKAKPAKGKKKGKK
ncbi:splicing regulator SDE2-like [Amphiura filiformis]|uniref:splicing regulator SDE2-like n=1 Tax=Amphiura filiformis TaxID=82378 RepID=UPI003B21BF07